MKQKKTLLAITVILYCAFLLPVFDWDIKVEAVAVLVMIELLWISKVFPIAYSSIILMIILSFHFFPFEETMSYFGSGIVWVLFSTFIISKASIYTGLANRLSLRILKLSGGSGKLLVINSFIVMLTLSPLFPSNVGKASLIASILDSVVNNLHKAYRTPNL
jgi:solute carrier family 13 (sodium-dependent dicarboxylate transporter), member 2/3/5